MTFQDLGNIGELIAAIATLLTLGYLAIQLKQNTKALRSQTFQQSSMDMSLTANSISSDGELAKIIIKAENGINKLSSDERLRFHFWMLVAVRRFESIYIQQNYSYNYFKFDQNRVNIEVLTSPEIFTLFPSNVRGSILPVPSAKLVPSV